MTWRQLILSSILIPIQGLISLCLAQLPSNSGLYQIRGKVIDSNSKAGIEFVTVSLFNQDSIYITGNATDFQGNFYFDQVNPGSFYLKFESIGYESYILKNDTLNSGHKIVDIGTIALKIQHRLMNEIIISTDKNLVQNLIDKKIFNVNKDLLSSGGNALNILERLPAVDVDIDGKISLKGNENVRILLDGRPTNLSQNEFLKQINASQIELVEIIANPSAKYDPEGMAGIINIVLKKSDHAGFNGSCSAAYSQGYHPRFNGGVQLNRRSDQNNISFDYGVNLTNQVSTNTGYKDVFTSPSYSFFSAGKNVNKANSQLFKSSFDYYLNSLQTIYSSITFQYRKLNTNGDYIYNYYDDQQLNYRFDNRANAGKGLGTNFDINAGWIKRFSRPNKSLNLDVLFKESNTNSKNYYLQTSLLNLLSDEKETLLDKGKSSSVKLDFINPITAKINIEAGLKLNYQEINNDYRISFKNEITQSYESDTLRTNHFIYREWIQAAYFTYSQTLGPISIKLGLRPEYTQSESELKNDLLPSFKTDYFRIFPSLNSIYNINQTNQLSFSVTRRINRPGTEQLNPFVNASDPYSLRYGNPYIKPEFAIQFDLGYTKQIRWGSINPSFYYRKLYNLIGRRVLLDTATAASVVEFINYPGQHAFGFDLNTNLNLFSWLKSTFNANFNKSFLIPGELFFNVNKSLHSFSSSLNILFPLQNGYNIQINSKYRATQLAFQGKLNFGSNVDLAFGKSILSSNLIFTLKITDIFNTRYFKFKSTGQAFYYSESERRNDTRSFGVFISYKFGKSDNNKSTKKELEDKPQERMDF